VAGASTAEAATCTATVNCAPKSVTFYKEGSTEYSKQAVSATAAGLINSGLQICGMEPRFSSYDAYALDATRDDPTGSGRTTEGNYTDSEAFSFKPSTKLATNDTITVSLPHPAEPYPNAGSVLPSSSQESVNSPSGPAFVPSVALDSSVTATSPSLLTFASQVKVTLVGDSAPERVQLKVWDPYDPPLLRPDSTVPNSMSILTNGYGVPSTYKLQVHSDQPDPQDGNQTVGLTSGGSSNTTTWSLAWIKQETLAFSVDVLMAANSPLGKEYPQYRIESTATASLNNGQVPPGSACGQAAVGTPQWLTSGNGPNYLVVVNNVGFPAQVSSVSTSGGAEIARITVPPMPRALTPTDTVSVLILDAESPPGQGTPQSALTSKTATPYPASSFSVSTNEDPVRGHPYPPPVFQADASDQIVQVGGGRADTLNSTLAVPNATALVGVTPNINATVTLRDYYNNPVNQTEVDLPEDSAQSTYGTPGLPSATVTPESPDDNGFAVTDKNGVANFGLADSCAQTVQYHAVDESDNIGPIGQVSSTWTAGAPVPPPPDGSVTPANCGPAPVESFVVVTSAKPTFFGPGVPATNPNDGTQAATVTMKMGDQFGNPAACQPVDLAATTTTPALKITRQLPPDISLNGVPLTCPGGNQPGFTNRTGVARFHVTKGADSVADPSLDTPVTFHVTGLNPFSAWPYGDAHTTDEARILFLHPAWSKSTVTAASPTAVASGDVSDTLTVTLLDSTGTPLQNQNVAVRACLFAGDVSQATCPNGVSTTAIVRASNGSVATDRNGQVSFDIGDSVSEHIHYEVSDTTQPIWQDAFGPSQFVDVGFVRSGLSLAAEPPARPELIGDGISLTNPGPNYGKTTLTMGMLDNNGNPGFPSDMVATIPVDPPGVRHLRLPLNPPRFIITGTARGRVTITAEAQYTPTSNFPCYGTVANGICSAFVSTNVTFLPPPYTYSLTASPASAPADSASASVVTVTALASDGSPAAGIPVLLNHSSTTQPIIFPSQPVTTNTLGQAFFSVTDGNVENVDLNASYVELDGSTPTSVASGCAAPGVQCDVTVDFTPTEASESGIEFTGADGTPLQPPPQDSAQTISSGPPGAACPSATCAVVTVTLRDANDHPINGDAVALFTGSAHTTVTPSNPNGVSGQTAPGQVQFYVSDTVAETLTLYARDLTAGAVIDHTIPLPSPAPPPVPLTLTVT
jgi:hypothetical protein